VYTILILDIQIGLINIDIIETTCNEGRLINCFLCKLYYKPHRLGSV